MGAVRVIAIILSVCLGVLAPALAEEAQDVGSETNLPLPRWVSLNAEEVNVRRGPGLDYRKDWVYRRKGLPVRIIDEYQHWRRIVDSDQTGGWVYHALLSGRRTVVVTAEMATLREAPRADALPVARAEHGVVARLDRCEPGWCEIDAGVASGWVSIADIWGVEADLR